MGLLAPSFQARLSGQICVGFCPLWFSVPLSTQGFQSPIATCWFPYDNNLNKIIAPKQFLCACCVLLLLLFPSSTFGCEIPDKYEERAFFSSLSRFLAFSSLSLCVCLSLFPAAFAVVRLLRDWIGSLFFRSILLLLPALRHPVFSLSGSPVSQPQILY